MPNQRCASLADLPALWELRTRAVCAGCASHYPPDVIAAWCMAGPPASMPLLVRMGGGVVAEEGGRMVGYAVLDAETGEVDALFVEPAWQGRGIASGLMAALEAMAREAGLERLFLFASLNAVPFYRRAGFSAVRDRMVAHRSGIAIRAVVMEKPLGRAA